MNTPKQPPAPSNLSLESKRVWRGIVAHFDLDGHHFEVLRLVCEALDRATQAQNVLDAEGIVTHDRFGQTKAHPCVAIKRDAEISAARLLRELDLDAEAAPASRRPPAVRSI